MEVIQEFGIELIQWLQQFSPGLDGVMYLFTFMGTIEFYMVFITFLYWVVDPKIGVRVFLVLLSTHVIAISSKILLHQPRPYWIGDVQALSTEHSYALPSAHSSDSLSIWVYLASLLKKRWLWIVSIATFLLISFSRMYLGVHFPLDLLFGWAIGLFVVFIFTRYGEKIGTWFEEKIISIQILYGFALSLVFALAGALSKLITAAFEAPDAWAHYAVDARELSGHFTLSGALFGTILGYILMKQYAQFSTAGPVWKKAARYGIGIIGVIVILYGLDPIFSALAQDESVLGYLLRYVRYGSACCWAMVGAPWVFLKLKLAGK